MSTNIKHEAVYPPAVFSLKKMNHQSPTSNNSKGSYELYDSQQSAADTLVDKKVNGISSSAPGSPGSVQDYRQVVLSLQRELEEIKKKNSDLQQIIAGMTSPQTQSSGSLVDGELVEGSSSNDSLGENVKDGHIKYLQRQVMVLQASLHQCDGWTTRLANAVKERDKALDEVTRRTNEIKNLQENNQQLQNRVQLLTVTLEETQRNLHQVTQDLQNQMRNSQLMSQLKEEAQRQKTEIATLKESLTRLDQENRSLKDSASEMGSQSLGSVPCSQELEHLHSVVDKLKSTVLEQRNYLLHLKRPGISRNGQSTSPSPATIGSLMPQDLPSCRKPTSPTFNAGVMSSAGGDIGNLQQPLAFTHLNQAVGLKSAALQEGFLDSRLNNYNSPDFGKEVGTGGRRKPSTQGNSDDLFNLDDLNSPQPLVPQGEGFVGLKPGSVPKVGGPSYPVAGKKSPEFLRQRGIGDTSENVTGQTAKSSAGYVLAGSPQHRTTKSEVLAYRNGLGKVATQEHWGSKSEIIRSPSHAYKPARDEIDNFSKVSPGLGLNQRYPMSRSLHQEVEENTYKGNFMPVEAQRQFFFGEGNVQTIGDRHCAVEYENMNLNSPTCHPQQIYHPPSSSQEASAQDMMAGAKLAMLAPPAHLQLCRGSGQEVLYVNTSSDQALGASNTTTGDADPSRTRLKLCPVCSSDFSHVSMEEFQTHVYECFDDENAPETMRPQTSPDKLCPMCNVKFGPETTQAEFEKHVHGHFGEDCPGENFVISQS